MIWVKEETWKILRQAYRFTKEMKAEFRTQFIQAAFAECYVASKLKNAGYDVKFHEDKCDVSVCLFRGEAKVQRIRLEVKHSEDNKEPDKYGHGFASWVISESQVEEPRFDLCILLRDSLKQEEPDAIYVFGCKEISATEKVDLNEKLNYYIWVSDHFDEINQKDAWMKNATSPLVESLHQNPNQFQERWNAILKGNLEDIIEDLI